MKDEPKPPKTAADGLEALSERLSALDLKISQFDLGPMPEVNLTEGMETLGKLSALDEKLDSELKQKLASFDDITSRIESQLLALPSAGGAPREVFAPLPAMPDLPRFEKPSPATPKAAPKPAPAPEKPPQRVIPEPPKPEPTPEPAPRPVAVEPARTESAPAAAPLPALVPSEPAREPVEERPEAPAGPSVPSWAPAAAAAFVLAAVAAALFLHSYDRPHTVHETYSLPYTHTAGIALREDRLFTGDPQRQLLFILDTNTGKVRGVEKLPNSSVRGLAWAADALWSSDGSKIYKHSQEADHAVIRSYLNIKEKPEALEWDGRRLWVGDPEAGTICQYDAGDALVLVRKLDFKDFPLGRFAIVGPTLYVVDEKTNVLHRYKMGEGAALEPQGRLDLAPWLQGSRKLTGLEAGASHLWLLLERPAEVRRLDLSALAFK